MAVLVTASPRISLTPLVVRASLLLLIVALPLSCGRRSVELSKPPGVEPSSDPTVVGSVNEQVSSLTVDAERLYWIGRYAALDMASGNTGTALHSCNKANCAASLVTYDSLQVFQWAPFAVRNGSVYWVQWTGLQDDHYQVVSCPIQGCQGAPRVVFVNQHGGFGVVTYGQEALYFLDGQVQSTVWQVPFIGGVDAQPLLANEPPPALPIDALAVNGEYLYALSRTDYQYSSLERARTDGSTQFERLADHLKILDRPAEQYATLAPLVNLAFDSDYVYWTSNTLTGSIQRCPLSGCAGAPEVLSGAIQDPTALQLDGATAYFQYFDAALGNSLTRCTLPKCEPSAPIVSGLDDGNVVAVDDQYVYTASSQTLSTLETSLDEPTAQIRRFPK